MPLWDYYDEGRVEDAELKPIMLEGWMANGIAAGGQLTTTSDVENFPGFPEGIVGGEICDKFRARVSGLGQGSTRRL
eukprot:jgi/Picre1/28810/NNA_004207.t1